MTTLLNGGLARRPAVRPFLSWFPAKIKEKEKLTKAVIFERIKGNDW